MRPSDTIRYVKNYIWWLLPERFKKKGEDSRHFEMASLFGWFLGDEDNTSDVRDTIIGAATNTAIATAEGSYLDRRGIDRRLKRRSGETDDDYRARLLNAATDRQKGGTVPGIISALSLLGYTVSVDEAFAYTSTWDRYYLVVTAWDGVNLNQADFYRQLRLNNAGHAIPLIDDDAVLDTFDDWSETNLIVSITNYAFIRLNVNQIGHGLVAGDYIEIFGATEYNGFAIVYQVIDANNFIISKSYLFVTGTGGYVRKLFDDWDEDIGPSPMLTNTFDDFVITP